MLSGNENEFVARGKNGQFLHVFPDYGVVVVVFSDFEDGLDSSEECESYFVHRMIAKVLTEGEN